MSLLPKNFALSETQWARRGKMLEIQEKLTPDGYEELIKRAADPSLHITEALDKNDVIGYIAYSYKPDVTVIYDYDDGGDLMLCDGLIRSVLFKTCLKGIEKVELKCSDEKCVPLERLRFVPEGVRVIEKPDSFMNGCKNCSH